MPETQKSLVFHRGAMSQTDRMAMDVKMITIEKPDTVPDGYSLVKVKAVGVNPVDAKYCYGDKLPESMSNIGKYLADGKGIGFDFSGTVVKSNNPDFDGKDVYGTVPPLAGSCKEYVLVPEHQIAIKPKNLTFEETAALPLVGTTSIQALNDSRFYDLKDMLSRKQGPRGGENKKLYLLLIGASGGVGHIALQVAKALDSNINVTCICSSRNERLVTDLGADSIVDYRKHGENSESLAQDLKDKVKQNSGKFDIIFDTVSSTEDKDMKPFSYRTVIREHGLLDEKAPYITIGGSLSEWCKAGFKRVFGLNSFGNNELFWIRMNYSHDVLEKLRMMCEEGKVKPVLADANDIQELSEDSVMDAFKKLHSRRVTGKVVLRGFQ